jgi:hypothetical protein
MMKIRNIEATDMGPDQQEIANWVENHLWNAEFINQEEFDKQEGSLIHLACNELGWHSVPQNGGLVVEWMEDDE